MATGTTTATRPSTSAMAKKTETGTAETEKSGETLMIAGISRNEGHAVTAVTEPLVAAGTTTTSTATTRLIRGIDPKSLVAHRHQRVGGLITPTRVGRFYPKNGATGEDAEVQPRGGHG